jgi:hypothetical protein
MCCPDFFMISENSRGQKLFQGDAREDDSNTMVLEMTCKEWWYFVENKTEQMIYVSEEPQTKKADCIPQACV